ncbi:hypothetical protein SARC_10280 [Sphaeroforma arctica JP610]|uniref:Uncharacterized protein n=1 Tax=Sphaeroforma arctica JP610 TaxID=667725 RepID=A0A0L0FLA3_9EUKA|nr:hypothetical protein SARC_10280 [Sphaeroforma arctica JP610]KNC77256.1 hypothetical protein SARC_10280 [Sphaeroforma arctica JP610]|eukprot:XP_014151158.1 hypothetical protein SARC_10280 [Sphaeroforma arctica JP610]
MTHFQCNQRSQPDHSLSFRCFRRATAGVCETTTVTSSCECTVDDPDDGFRTVTVTIDKQEQPTGNLGGCPDASVTQEPCKCEPCTGKWEDVIISGNRSRCQWNGNACVQKEKFVLVNNNGDIYEDQDDTANISECLERGACDPCVEEYIDIQSNVLCGSGTQYGFYNKTQEPGIASEGGNKGDELSCKCEDSGVLCTSGQWVELPEDQCTGSNSNPCKCDELDVAKFYRPPIDADSYFPTGFPANKNALKYKLREVDTTSVFSLEELIEIENEENRKVVYTAEFRDATIDIKSQVTGKSLIKSLFGDQTKDVSIGATTTVKVHFPYSDRSLKSTFNTDLDSTLANSDNKEYQAFTVETSAYGPVTGGGNQVNAISGSYGLDITVTYNYEGCKLNPEVGYKATQYSECTADESV